MNLYIASSTMPAAALLMAIAEMAVDAIMGPSRLDKVKNTNYECGYGPTPNHDNQARLPAKYYLIAMMLIIFNTEVVFPYPWAVSFMKQGKLGMLAMTLFVRLLTAPFIYV